MMLQKISPMRMKIVIHRKISEKEKSRSSKWIWWIMASVQGQTLPQVVRRLQVHNMMRPVILQSVHLTIIMPQAGSLLEEFLLDGFVTISAQVMKQSYMNIRLGMVILRTPIQKIGLFKEVLMVIHG